MEITRGSVQTQTEIGNDSYCISPSVTVCKYNLFLLSFVCDSECDLIPEFMLRKTKRGYLVAKLQKRREKNLHGAFGSGRMRKRVGCTTNSRTVKCIAARSIWETHSPRTSRRCQCMGAGASAWKENSLNAVCSRPVNSFEFRGRSLNA